MLKRILLTVVLYAAATMGTAATVNNVTPVPGGPTVTDPGTLVVASLAGVSVTGSGGAMTTAAGVFPGDPLFVTVDFPFAGSASLTGFIAPTPYLTGIFVDSTESVGMIQALFSTTGGLLAPEFGPLFRVTILSSLFDGAVLSDPIGVFDPLATTVFEAVAPIPLPAAAWLLLAALGGLFGMSRRRNTA